jgi:hypothetical protein
MVFPLSTRVAFVISLSLSLSLSLSFAFSCVVVQKQSVRLRISLSLERALTGEIEREQRENRDNFTISLLQLSPPLPPPPSFRDTFNRECSPLSKGMIITIRSTAKEQRRREGEREIKGVNA